MTNRTYFLPPDFLSYPAPQPSNPGSIRLGQLISNIDDPGHTIGTLPPLDMTEYKVPIGVVTAAGMGHKDNESSSFYARAFLRAAELIGLQSRTHTGDTNELLSAMQGVEAQTIEPNDSYVKASMEQKEVKAWLGETWI